MRAAVRRVVVGGADADQDSAGLLMTEVQLDLLERPLDQEAREGMHDRPHSGQRQAAGHADRQLLADPQVDHPVRVPLPGRPELLGGDVGKHHRKPRVLIEKLRRDGRKTLTHGIHRQSLTLAPAR